MYKNCLPHKKIFENNFENLKDEFTKLRKEMENFKEVIKEKQ